VSISEGLQQRVLYLRICVGTYMQALIKSRKSWIRKKTSKLTAYLKYLSCFHTGCPTPISAPHHRPAQPMESQHSCYNMQNNCSGSVASIFSIWISIISYSPESISPFVPYVYQPHSQYHIIQVLKVILSLYILYVGIYVHAKGVGITWWIDFKSAICYCSGSSWKKTVFW